MQFTYLLLAAALGSVACVRDLDVAQQLVSKAEAGLVDKPWFCHDLDCPEFTVRPVRISDAGTPHREGRYAPDREGKPV